MLHVQSKKPTIYRATILRLKPGDARITELPDWSERFNGSVGAGQRQIEEGLTLPKGGVIVLSKKNTESSGSPVHFLLSTGTVENVVMDKGKDIPSPSDESPRGPFRRRKSAWRSLQTKIGGFMAFNKGRIPDNAKNEDARCVCLW